MEDVRLRGKQADHPRKLSKYDCMKIILLKRVGRSFLYSSVKHSLVQTVAATQGR